MPTARRSWPWALGAVVLVLAVAVGALGWRGRDAARADREARAAAVAFASAWTGGRLSSVSYADAAPASVASTYAALTKGMAPARPSVTLRSLERTGATASGRQHVIWALPGGATWQYEVPVQLRSSGGRWAVLAPVSFTPEPATSLRLQRVQSPRAQILGRDGAVLVTERPVVDVGVQPSRVKGSAASLARRLSSLVDVDAAPLTKRIESASPEAFVPVITLRRSDYDPVRSRLRPLSGVLFRERRQALAPTRDFARALLGTVGPVTADLVAAGKGRYLSGDVAGVSGLQRQYDERLGGAAGVSVVSSSGGGAVRTLFETKPSPGRALSLTLDPAVQRAADAALAGISSSVEAALVAVDVRTGGVLAVANAPASGLNRAMVGQYPPGSTFKVVTTFALLQRGLRPSDAVPCPPTATVSGRAFRNYESEQLGVVPFTTDFAKSCNTAFVGLSSRLGPADLRAAAARLGIGVTYGLGAPAFSGSVPVTTSDVDRAAAAFGQGRNLVSPLSLAVATASVARGSYLAPSLVVDPATEPPHPVALPRGPVTDLRSLMRSVVTGGTGTALGSVLGAPVFAKTGTAEFGSGSPPQTHAWITGWQGDVAFTVFVDVGKSGGTVAGPVAARFLRALERRPS